MSHDKASIKELDTLHSLLAKSMTQRLRKAAEGEPLTAAEWSAVAKFLKDNSVEQVAIPGNPLGDLRGALMDLPYASEGASFSQ